MFKADGDQQDTDSTEGADLSLCVPLGEALGVIDQLALPEDERACPATPAPECGQTGADGQLISCGVNQDCSCMAFRCTEKYEPCDQDRRWVATGVCLTPEENAQFEQSQPNLLTGLCNEATFPEKCGIPGLNGMPITCPANTTCICETNECAVQVPTSVCPSGYARAVDYTPGQEPVCIELSGDTSTDESTDTGDTGPGPEMDGFCPGWG